MLHWRDRIRATFGEIGYSVALILNATDWERPIQLPPDWWWFGAFKGVQIERL